MIFLASCLLSTLSILPQETELTRPFLEVLEKNFPQPDKVWKIVAREDCKPFLFFVSSPADPQEIFSHTVVKDFGPPLAAVAGYWKTYWESRLQLKRRDPSAVVPIAFFKTRTDYQKAIAELTTWETVLPPAFEDPRGILLTYAEGDSLESTFARFRSVAKHALPGLLNLYGLPEKQPRPAWLDLGLAYGFSQFRSKRGPRGTEWTLGDVAHWRSNLSAMADELYRMDVAIPPLSELLTLRKIPESGQDGLTEESAAVLRRYLGYFGHSLFSFCFSENGKPYYGEFRSFVKQELGAQEERRDLPERFGEKLAAFEKDWEAFCDVKRPPETVRQKLPAKEKIREKPARQRPKIPETVPLDFFPRDLLGIRAEIIRKVQSSDFPAALSLAEKPEIRNLGGENFAHDVENLEAARRLYRMFGSTCKEGERLPSPFHVAGTLERITEEGFEVRDRYATQSMTWEELDLRAVANHLYYKLKHQDSRTTTDVIRAKLLCGEAQSAGKILSRLSKEHPALVLLDEISEWEATGREAAARETIAEAVSSAKNQNNSLGVLEQLMRNKEVRASQSFLLAEPHLRGLLAEIFAEQFDRQGLKTIFLGEVEQNEEGGVLIRYPFQKQEELRDWRSEDGKYIKRIDPKNESVEGSWEVQDGKLLGKPSGILRHVAEWEGDVNLEFTFLVPDQDMEEGFIVIGGAVADDGKGDFVANIGLTALGHYHADGNFHYSKEQERTSIITEASYDVRIEVKGQSIQTYFDGNSAGSLVIEERKGKKVFLYLSGTAVGQFRKVVIRGKLDPEWIEDQKTLWILGRIQSFLGT